MVGVKHDKGKPRVDLLPPRALLLVGEVLGFGANVYGDDNWRAVVGAKKRYVAAALRHLLKHMAGEKLDADSGLPHLAHAACCVLFVLELEGEDADDTGKLSGDSEGTVGCTWPCK